MNKLLGIAQIILSLIITIGFLSLLFLLILHPMDLSSTETTIVTGLLASLGTVFTLSANFWFARHRPNDNPQQPVGPASTEIK